MLCKLSALKINQKATRDLLSLFSLRVAVVELTVFFVARRVFGYSTLLASVLTLVTPGAAVLGFGWVVAVRTLLGVLLGATWPAILPMASKWIPPMDRSKFMSNMMGKSKSCKFLFVCDGLPSLLDDYDCLA